MLLSKRRDSRTNAFHARARFFVFMILFVLSVACAPASACMMSCAYSEAGGRYDRVFSGLIISTESIPDPTVDRAAPAAATPNDTAVHDFGFWTKSQILVLHTWRGSPPTVAEVWTPGGTSCDLPMIAGFHFVALARIEKNRSIAFHTNCEGDLNIEAILGRGTYTTAGVGIIAATVFVAALGLTWVGVAISRLRRSDRPSARLPSALCFAATMLPVAPVIYLILFQGVVAAMASLIALLFWSKILAHLSAFDFWKRNAGWLLANVVGALSIASVLNMKLDINSEHASFLDTLASVAVWIYVACASALILSLLTALKAIQQRRS
jgi:hypothetical protein